MGAFGEKLRKLRELRGIELDAISNTTKISTRMLRALEDEHFDQLPGGVFNKGFVRAYARQIGLDEEEAVADYLAALRGDQPRQSSANVNVPEFSVPAAKMPIVAAPELRDHAPIPSAPPTHDLPANDRSNSNNKDSGHDRHQDLRREDRRKLSRRFDERRIENRRSNHEDRRDDDRRDDDRRNKDRRNPPRAQRFHQKYPAGDPEPANPSTAPIPWGQLALALLVLTLLLALWNFRRAQPPAPSPAIASSNHPPVSIPTPAASEPSGSAALTASSPAVHLPRGTPSSATISTPTAPPAKPAPQTVPASTSPANQLSPAASPIASPAASSSATVNKSTVNPPQPNPKPPAIQATSPATAPVAAPVAAPLAAKPPSTFTVQVRADKTTWVSLSADGKLVAQETLIAPAHTSARATREIVVKTGNAAAIRFLLNGKEIPAQGNEGEAKTYIFNATGFQIAP